MAVGYIPSSFLGVRKARHQVFNMFLDELKPGKLLDVGCGDGGFLHRMHTLGWAPTGLDFDGKAIENAKALYGKSMTVMHTDLLGAGFPEGEFDAVTMNHVIEHVPDPVGVLREARRVLKVGGRLVVTTPNIRSLGHRMFSESWRGLETPRHLQIFTRAAIRACAQKAGFKQVSASTTAANADTIIGASFSLVEAQKNEDYSSGSRIKINLIRGLRSLLLQYREAIQLRQDPECGEELVLICEK
jgi:2-polyprenyl-3-methyl-5-hydroxy-6-metoxy-1,4-benzoquinol methylase